MSEAIKEPMFVFTVITEDNVHHKVQASWVKVRKRQVTFYVHKRAPFIVARFLKYKSFKITERIKN